MPNNFNPLTAPLSALKQMGEQANVAAQSVGGSLTQAASQGLDAIISAVPSVPIPGVPTAPAAGAGQLLPANLQKAITQVETMLLPPGLPKPSSVIGAPTTTPPPRETPPAQGATPPTTRVTRQVIPERRGM